MQEPFSVQTDLAMWLMDHASHSRFILERICIPGLTARLVHSFRDCPIYFCLPLTGLFPTSSLESFPFPALALHPEAMVRCLRDDELEGEWQTEVVSVNPEMECVASRVLADRGADPPKNESGIK